jgi:hypothetical protein
MKSGPFLAEDTFQEFPTDKFQLKFKSKTKSQLLKLVAPSGIANDNHECPS